MVEAIPALTTDKAVKLYESFGVFTKAELESRAEVEYEAYGKMINIEARTMIDMASKQIIPAVIKYTTQLAGSLGAVKAACPEADTSVQAELLTETSALLSDMKVALAALIDITEEAACVDGASNGVIFRKIILPMVAPLLTIVVMLRFVDAFKVFDTVYVMTNGGPGTSTEMLPNYIYKQGLRFFDAGYSAALAIGFVVVMTVVTVGFLKLRTKLEA